jgi:hypothetical protein
MIGATGSILVALITGIFHVEETQKLPPPPPAVVAITDCPAEQGGVITLIRDHPEIAPTYSGPVEDQCHLNEVAQQEEHHQSNGGPNSGHP